ncbi:spore germination protein [Cohnella nanjingensis]|uniref:Spore germination protein n=1 Tax=Cohnella nanjingensis TaxID=1387779 RepID=A0A7X0VI83_9BACL|nr:spore germination protein [Cohnella nanjingensis]MBB6673404.1 spore germination protein [Cohnella nanjingensis]
MPSIVGAVKILTVGSSGVVLFGDTLQVKPVSTTKTFAGAGSFVTGDFPRTNSISSTNTNDPDVVDSSSTEVGNSGII